MTPAEQGPDPDADKAAGGTPAWPVIDKPSRGFRSPAALGAAVVVVAAFAVAISVRAGTSDSPPAGSGGPAATAPAPSSSRLTATPIPDPSAGARAAEPGDCLAISGPPEAQHARIARCGPGNYLVVARFDDTQDAERCDTVPTADHVYTEEDFVLCLKRLR